MCIDCGVFGLGFQVRVMIRMRAMVVVRIRIRFRVRGWVGVRVLGRVGVRVDRCLGKISIVTYSRN